MLRRSSLFLIFLPVISGTDQSLYISFTTARSEYVAPEAQQSLECPLEQLEQLCRKSPGSYPAAYAGQCACLECAALCSSADQSDLEWCAAWTHRGFCSSQWALNETEAVATSNSSEQSPLVIADDSAVEQLKWILPTILVPFFVFLIFTVVVYCICGKKYLKKIAQNRRDEHLVEEGQLGTQIQPADARTDAQFTTLDNLHRNLQAEVAQDGDRLIEVPGLEMKPETHLLTKRSFFLTIVTLARLFRIGQAEAAC